MSEVSLPGAEEEDEHILIQRARKNDYRAYERLYRLHVGRVFGLCVRLCNDRDMAEDLTQETFVSAWKKLSAFRGDSSFGTWLYRIGTNTTLSYLRKQTPFKYSVDIEDTQDKGVEDGMAESLSLDTALQQLPDGARVVFVLYSLEGYTHDEIGKMLGIATGSSKAQLHRARQLLKASLEIV